MDWAKTCLTDLRRTGKRALEKTKLETKRRQIRNLMREIWVFRETAKTRLMTSEIHKVHTNIWMLTCRITKWVTCLCILLVSFRDKCIRIQHNISKDRPNSKTSRSIPTQDHPTIPIPRELNLYSQMFRDSSSTRDYLVHPSWTTELQLIIHLNNPWDPSLASIKR